MAHAPGSVRHGVVWRSTFSCVVPYADFPTDAVNTPLLAHSRSPVRSRRRRQDTCLSHTHEPVTGNLELAVGWTARLLTLAASADTANTPRFASSRQPVQPVPQKSAYLSHTSQSRKPEPRDHRWIGLHSSVVCANCYRDRRTSVGVSVGRLRRKPVSVSYMMKYAVKHVSQRDSHRSPSRCGTRWGYREGPAGGRLSALAAQTARLAMVEDVDRHGSKERGV